jgi:hypothetical protein
MILVSRVGYIAIESLWIALCCEGSVGGGNIILAYSEFGVSFGIRRLLQIVCRLHMRRKHHSGGDFMVAEGFARNMVILG